MKFTREKIINYLKKLGWIGFFLFLLKGIGWLVLLYLAKKGLIDGFG